MNKEQLFEKFTKIKANTKRARGIVASYIRCQRNGDSIYNAYVKPSEEKKDAFAYCQKMLSECKGTQPKITGKSTYEFSYAFKCQDENGDWYLIYITRCNDYIIELYRSCV